MQMRVLVTCTTGPVDENHVRAALAPLGWLPADGNASYVGRQTEAILDRLPAHVREELQDTGPILIEVGAGVWGFCSLERKEVLNFRLLSDRIDALQEVAEKIVRSFPAAFANATSGREVAFPEPVEIRKRENEDRIAHGDVSYARHLRFLQYVAAERRRERRLGVVLLSLFVFVAACSAVLYASSDLRLADYVRGWFDRIASALAVAVLTTFVNLRFEYVDWRKKGVHVAWHFGSLSAKPL